jgi:hypothetical protein
VILSTRLRKKNKAATQKIKHAGTKGLLRNSPKRWRNPENALNPDVVGLGVKFWNIPSQPFAKLLAKDPAFQGSGKNMTEHGGDLAP